MIKNMTKFEVEIGEKIYQFLLDQDSPVMHAKEAVFQFGKFLGQIEDQIKAQQKNQEAQEAAKKEESPQQEG